MPLKSKAASKIIEMRKDFIANASHELKTPITIIRGFAEMLRDFPNLPEEKQREVVDKIIKTCGRLEKLVKSLLTLADLENVEEHFYTKDLFPLLEACRQLIFTLYPDVDIQILSPKKSIHVHGDHDLLELAIMNLLENAVKYSKKEAKIHLSFEQKNDKLRLSIQDEGIGIPKEDLSLIFERFYTVDKARSRKSGGAGLGLSIVKTIIEKHRGSVEVTSELGVGSTFVLILPIKEGL